MKGNNYITEIIIGGAKCYSYTLYKPNTQKYEYVIKQKGITIYRANIN